MPQSAALRNDVRLSEFLPNPKAHGTNEWVELANDADTPVELSGWAIDDADGGGSPYRLPEGSVIAPHGLLLVELPKALFNNAGDSVRLLRPDDQIADQYNYGQAGADQSFCRVDGIWTACTPTPNAPNQAVAQHAAPSPTASPELQTAALGGADTLSGDAARPVALATPAFFAIQSDAITALPSYAYPTGGVLYRGVAPTPSAPASPPALVPHRAPRAAAPSSGRSGAQLGMGAGLFLCAAGGAIAGYDQLRARRLPMPIPTSDPEELCEEIDDSGEEEVDDERL